MIERPRRWCRNWALWQAPRRIVIYVLTVNVVAAVVTIASAAQQPIARSDLGRFAVLALCTWVAIELTRHIERKREHARSSTVAYVDTKAVWSFAAVIILPVALASAIVVLSYLLSWSRVRPHLRHHIVHRWVFSTSTVILGTYAAAFVLANGMSSYPGAPGSTPLVAMADFGVIAVAGLLRWGINAGMIVAAIALSNPSVQVRELFSSFGEQLLEAGSYALGVVVALVIVTNPFMLPAILVAMVALHRGTLVGQYQRASRRDTKTGLASAGWWHESAEQTLARTEDRKATTGLLMVDLDHFKVINDTYGHPFGDQVLRAVAEELRAEVRDEDACGRWGGEEFAVILPDIRSAQDLYRVAERIRLRIQAIELAPSGETPDEEPVRLTASLGGALFPAKGITSLDELLLAADAALYQAKNGGRNVVRLSPTVPVTTTDDAPEPIEKPQQISNPRPSAN